MPTTPLATLREEKRRQEFAKQVKMAAPPRKHTTKKANTKSKASAATPKTRSIKVTKTPDGATLFKF